MFVVSRLTNFIRTQRLKAELYQLETDWFMSDIERIITALGLDKEATADDIVAAIEKLKANQRDTT